MKCAFLSVKGDFCSKMSISNWCFSCSTGTVYTDHWIKKKNPIRNLMRCSDFPGGSEVKVSAWNTGDPGLIPGFDPWVGKIPWRSKWKPTSVLLPGKFHGQSSLVGYSPWGRKESDTTERLHSLIVIDIDVILLLYIQQS